MRSEPVGDIRPNHYREGVMSVAQRAIEAREEARLEKLSVRQRRMEKAAARVMCREVMPERLCTPLGCYCWPCAEVDRVLDSGKGRAAV